MTDLNPRQRRTLLTATLTLTLIGLIPWVIFITGQIILTWQEVLG